jgi:hypothetical protein
MTTQPELLNATELRARLGLGATRFNELRRAGKWDHLRVKGPVGYRVYSRLLVDRYLAGESTVQLGSRRDRR